MGEKSLVEAVAESLREADLPAKDAGTAALALAYAATIEAGGDLDRMGLQLLAVLDSLLLTARARAVVNKGVTSAGLSDNPLDELKQRRNARQNRAPDLDSTAT